MAHAHGKTKTHVVVKDHGFDALMKRLKDLGQLKKRTVRVGVLADDAKGGLHKEGGKLTLAEIFAILNFGTRDGHIPPAPVLQTVFDEERDELRELGLKLMGGVVFGNLTLDQALGIMGATLANKVKAAITHGFPPPNAPSTALGKAMKGKTKSLFTARGAKLTATSSKRATARLKGLGDAFAAIGATQAAIQHGYGLGLRFKKTGIRAAANIGEALAQIGALASVKRFIDTGQLLGAITWAVGSGEGESHETHGHEH